MSKNNKSEKQVVYKELNVDLKPFIQIKNSVVYKDTRLSFISKYIFYVFMIA